MGVECYTSSGISSLHYGPLAWLNRMGLCSTGQLTNNTPPPEICSVSCVGITQGGKCKCISMCYPGSFNYSQTQLLMGYIVMDLVGGGVSNCAGIISGDDGNLNNCKNKSASNVL